MDAYHRPDKSAQERLKWKRKKIELPGDDYIYYYISIFAAIEGHECELNCCHRDTPKATHTIVLLFDYKNFEKKYIGRQFI